MFETITRAARILASRYGNRSLILGWLILLSAVVLVQDSLAQTLIPSTFPGGTAIQGRARWGGTGFEGGLYIGGTVGPNLNPAGTPVWVIGTLYKFEYTYTVLTGFQTLKIDFNNDNSFGAGEVITQSTPYANQAFKHFGIFMSGNATRGITLNNFVVNGTNLGSYTSPPTGAVDQTWETSIGHFGNILATGDITFTGAAGPGDEIGRIWFRTATPVDPTPTVTVNQAVAPQTDPTSTSPINFTATFSEPVTGFDASDVTLGGTAAGPTSAVVTGGGSTYNIAVSGMTSTGTVTATVTAGGAQSISSGVSNAASTSSDNTVTFYTCNNISIATGQTTLRNAALTIPITTNSMTGQEVYSYDFTYTYNASTLTYTGYSTAGTLSSGFTMTVHSPAAGTLVFSGFGSTPLSGAGTLLNVNFTASGPIGSTSNLTLSPFTLNEGVPCANVTNGDITIISGTVDGTITYLNSNGNAPNPRVVAGVNLNAPGTPPVSGLTNGSGVYSLSGFGNSGYTVTPSKSPVAWNDPLNGISANDAARVAQHVVGVLPMTSNQQLAADVSNNGTITSFDSSIIARFVVNIPVPGVTGTWRFAPTNRSYVVSQLETGVTGENYDAILMGDVTGNWNSTGALWENLTDFEREQAIEVLLPEMTAGTGSEIVIPVRAGDTTGKGVISYQFELRYDPNVLAVGKTPCIAADTLSSTMTVTCNSEEPGIVRVAVFGVNDMLGKGELLRLKFNVTGEANSFSNLELVGFKFNESFPFGVARNGRVTVTEAAPSDSIGGRVLTSTGEPVGQARVTVTDQNGNARTMATNNFGNFRFAGLVNGGTYTVEVAARGLRFTPRSIVVGPNAGSIDITAEP